MIKEILKSLLVRADSNPDLGFPTPNIFLERPLRDMYYEYYHKGSGMVVLSALLAMFVAGVILGDKVTKTISKISILLIALVWVTPSTFTLRFSAFHLSPLYLPTLGIPIEIIYLLLGFSSLIILHSFRNMLKASCSPIVCRITDISLLIFGFILFLPWISGETWIAWS